jgi:hypothetical protein
VLAALATAAALTQLGQEPVDSGGVHLVAGGSVLAGPGLPGQLRFELAGLGWVLAVPVF